MLNWAFSHQACPFGLGIRSHSNNDYYQNVNEHSLGALRGAPTSPWLEHLFDEQGGSPRAGVSPRRWPGTPHGALGSGLAACRVLSGPGSGEAQGTCQCETAPHTPPRGSLAFRAGPTLLTPHRGRVQGRQNHYDGLRGPEAELDGAGHCVSISNTSGGFEKNFSFPLKTPVPRTHRYPAPRYPA